MSSGTLPGETRIATAGLKTRLFLVFAAGYFLSYVYRTVNAVLSPYLASELGLEAGDLGILTGAYFIAFAAFQLPLGILLDRYGPRRVQAALLLIAALGAGLFAVGHSLVALTLARALIGFGVSGCLMAGFKALVVWFPRERLPLFNGLFMVSGGLGAIAAATPVEMALEMTDWRGVFALLTAATIGVSAAIFLGAPKDPAPKAGQSLGEALEGIVAVFKAPIFIRLAPLTSMAQGVFLSYLSLWTGAWLRDVNGLSPRDAADAVLLAATAMSLGFLSIGVIADQLGKRGVPPMMVGVGGMMLFIALQVLIVAGAPIPPVAAWFLFGYLGTACSSVYAVMSLNLPLHLSGRSNTAINLLAFLAAFVMQSGVGSLLDLLGPLPGGRATPDAHRMALGLMVALELAGLLWFWFRKPTLKA
ncbi:MFS transporter [Lacibacterium aquatile]|uniref:MFS transporter n=1 Tax=Lacibacterium aquatile TaxID=1168082 RepID=A0ABW5DSG2_9PROT